MAKKEVKPKNLVKAATRQRKSSIKHKKGRMDDIKTSENMYFGKVEEQLRNRFNVPIPVMSGFVEHLEAKIDEPPSITYNHQEESDYKKAQKVTAAWRSEANSSTPNHKWPQKDRWAKKLAIFSGRGIFKYYSESDPKYKSNLEVVDHYDFHCEPRGGGNLENHLFVGQDNIFKSKERLQEGAKEGIYNKAQVANLIEKSSRANKSKKVENQYGQKVNRFKNLGLDVQNNYTGQMIFTLSEWYLNYKGQRWYLLFDPNTGMYLRAEPLTEIFDSGRYPFVSWATHEEAKVFWSKAPADDMRPIHDSIVTLVNQELDNRQKRNRDKKAFDPDMFEDMAALDSWQPEKLVPANTDGGTRRISEGIYQFETPALNGTLNLASWLDSFAGSKSGITPGSQGAAEEDKKVGIYFGELQQISDRLGLINKSYREGWEELGRKYIEGLEENLDDEMAIKLIGSSGIDHTSLTRKDLKTEKTFDINVVGGNENAKAEEMNRQKKESSLDRIVKYGLPVNKQWLTEQVLRVGSWDDAEIAMAMNTEGTDKELMAEAAKAIQDILKGRNPNLNRGADLAFMQKIIDFAIENSEFEVQNGEPVIVDEGSIDRETYKQLMKYAMAHKNIVRRNMLEKAKGTVLEENKTEGDVEPSKRSKPENPALTKGSVSSITQQLTNKVMNKQGKPSRVPGSVS